MFKNIFMIQNESFSSREEFLSLLKDATGIPVDILKEQSSDDQIMLNEHYFKNFYNFFLKEEFTDYDSFIQQINEASIAELIFDTIKMSIFHYKILD